MKGLRKFWQIWLRPTVPDQIPYWGQSLWELYDHWSPVECSQVSGHDTRSQAAHKKTTEGQWHVKDRGMKTAIFKFWTDETVWLCWIWVGYLVQMLQGQHDLSNVQGYFFLLESHPLYQMCEELPAIYVICDERYPVTFHPKKYKLMCFSRWEFSCFYWHRHNTGVYMWKNILTEYEVQLGIRLKGVVESDEERRLADVLQDLSLCARVFRGLGLLYNSGLLQDLHGIQLSCIMTAHFPHQEHLAVRWWL